MAYEGYCAACTYLKEEGDYRGYWCSKRGEYHGANDPKCYRFCEAYGRSNSARQNMYEYSANSSGGCYLTTIMCNILNYQDDNYYLKTLRNFRDNVMKTNPKYIPLLITYDTIGPQIASKLETDPNKEIIATTIFNRYITSSVLAIEENKHEEAINIYKSMTYSLASYYNIDTNVVNIDASNINTSSLGHGKIRRLIPKEEL